MVLLTRGSCHSFYLASRQPIAKKFSISPAELVYGKNVRLHSDPVLDIRAGLKTIGLLRLLKYAMPKLKPSPPANHAKIVADPGISNPVYMS